MLVVDASVLATAVVDSGSDGRRFRERLRGETVAGPDLLRLEVVSVVRRRHRAGELSVERATEAIADLTDLPIRVYPTAPLLSRVWALRENLSPYDAAYVALAEALDVALLTADRRLAAAPGIGCPVEVL